MTITVSWMRDLSDADWKIIRVDGTEEKLQRGEFTYLEDGRCVGVVFPDHSLQSGDRVQITNRVSAL